MSISKELIPQSDPKKLTDEMIRWKEQEINLVKELADKLKKCECKETGDTTINFDRYKYVLYALAIKHIYPLFTLL